MSTPPPPPGFNQPPNYGSPQPGYGAPPPPPPAYGQPQPGYGQPQQQGYGNPPPGYQPYQNQQPQQRQYAGLGSRFGAVLLDGLVGLIFYAPAIISIFAVPTEYTDCTVNGRNSICEVPTAAGWAIIAVLGIVGLVAYLTIYCKKVGNSQSWGQKACGIRVVDQGTNAQIGTGRAVGRYFAKILSGSFCGLGYLWALWDKDKQTWHDKLVNSVVVKA